MTAAKQTLRFALNHMAAPRLGLRAFFSLASRLGVAEVEIRNDIDGQAILDGTPAREVGRIAAESGVSILTINALQRFNDWSGEREAEARALARYARECGAWALVLVPVNDGSGREGGKRQSSVRSALRGLRPILDEYGVTGLVEPLGFESCSLRSKREAADAIHDIDGAGVFRLTHDTFHHHLAGEPELFPGITGLVHISGVADPGVALRDMRDCHRVLVDANDRIGNLEQIEALRRAGCAGAFSYEPFADDIGRLADPEPAIRESMDFIRASLAAAA